MPSLRATSATVIGVVLTLGACGSGNDDPNATASAQSAAAIEQAFRNANDGAQIDSLCDKKKTHWACSYTGLTAKGNEVTVNLRTKADLSAKQAAALAHKSGVDWFDAVGCTYPSLSAILVNLNGTVYNVQRSDSSEASAC